MLPKVLAVFLGGGLGSLLRFAAALLAERFLGPPRAVADARRFSELLPAGTLAVNILGCLAIGALVPLLMRNHDPARELLRLALVTGLLGGFTTFSAFGLETLRLFQGGRPAWALAYAVASVLLGVAAAALGAWAASTFLAARPHP